MRDFDRCKSTFPALASRAGWMRSRARPRRLSPAWPKYPRASPDSPFAGQRSLIVGGSRGLGEVTAKIVAAGGGYPVITYMESKDEAERVAAEILRRRRPMRNPALRCAARRQRSNCRNSAPSIAATISRPQRYSSASRLYSSRRSCAHSCASMPTASPISAPRWPKTATGKLADVLSLDGCHRRAHQLDRGICDGEDGRRNPGEAPERIHVRHSRDMPPPAPNSDRSNRNRRRCQRRARVGRDASYCI